MSNSSRHIARHAREQGRGSLEHGGLSGAKADVSVGQQIFCTRCAVALFVALLTKLLRAALA